MKMLLIKFLLITILAVMVVALSLFIGKTTFADGKLYIERPWTALAMLITLLLGIFDK